MKIALLKLTVILLLNMFYATIPAVSSENGYTGYKSLDSTEPVTFDGEKIEWRGRRFILDKNTLFISLFP